MKIDKIKYTISYIKCALSIVIINFLYTNVLSQTTTTYTYSGSIQTFTVPAGVTSIVVEAYGAAGGDGTSVYGTSLTPGGLGAYIKGTISVTPGENLSILVGQKGGSSGGPHGNENGGGGGSFVVRQTGTVPLVIAGGGGGAPSTSYGTSCSRTYSLAHGQAGNSGSSISCSSSASGGTGGNGGSTAGSYQGGAGGGFSTNGANGGTHCSQAIGGRSFTNGGAGGAGNSCYSTNNYGGFGGGGGGQLGSPGGGGGYSGGASAGSWSSYSTYGGGGGSYNAGTNQTNTSGVRSGNGLITLTYYSCTQLSPLASTPNFTFRANLESTDSKGWTCYCDSVGKLLIALKIGGSGAVINKNLVKLKIGNYKTYSTTSSGGMITNFNGYSIIERRWDVTPTTQPSSQVGVKYFFTKEEYDSLKNRLSAMASPSNITSVNQLNMYKTTSGSAFANPHSVSGIVYSNNSSPSLNTWKDSLIGTTIYTAEFYVSSFSGGSAGFGGGGIPLPLDELKFSAENINNEVKITWENHEKGIFMYELEKQKEFNNWENILSIPSNNQYYKYEYWDKTSINDAIQHKNNFINYRLKIKYYNGMFHYSDINTIELSQLINKTPLLEIHPIPANDFIQITNNSNQNGKLEIINLLGEIVLTRELENKQNLIDISSLNNGLYVVKYTIKNKVENYNIIIN